MSGDDYGLDFGSMSDTAEAWRALGETMTTTSTSFSDQSTAPLAPSVQGAAAAFLTAWAGYAAESAAIAEGLATALETVSQDASMTDDAVMAELDGLDTRLGPST